MAEFELDCGISRRRIVGWLDDELCLPRDDEFWIFVSDDSTCRVSASPLENRAFATIELERTLLSVNGDKTAVDTFRQLFILRFASAGG